VTALKTGSATSGTTAADIDTGITDVNEVRLIIRNHGSVTAYLGGSDVTAANGFPVEAGEAYEWPVRVGRSGAVYHVVASGTCDLRWMAVA
jgi:hypothetical protein